MSLVREFAMLDARLAERDELRAEVEQLRGWVIRQSLELQNLRAKTAQLEAERDSWRARSRS